MIPNLTKLTNAPIARTNLILLEGNQLKIIEHLLAPVPNIYMIDFMVRCFHQEKNETPDQYHIRIHQEIKSYIRQKLRLMDARQDIEYELHRLPDNQYVFFFLSPAVASDDPAYSSLIDRINNFCQQLESKNINLSHLIQGLFALYFKIAMLEQVNAHFPVPPVYFNSALYLNARLTQKTTKNNNQGVIEAFELDIYFSEYNELVFTLHKQKFLTEPTNEFYPSLDDISIWFNINNKKFKARHKLDARDSKLDFFRERSGYGECQAYTYNVVMNIASDLLTELEIAHYPGTFQATHEVNQFLTNLDSKLNNILFVVNNGVKFNGRQETYLFNVLNEQFPDYKLLQLESFKQAQQTNFANFPENASILVLNAVNGERNNSICQKNNVTAEYSDFYAAFNTARKKTDLEWDTYTQLKLERLLGWLNHKPLPVVLQGMDIDCKLLDEINFINELSVNNPHQYKTDLANHRSHLKSAINLLGNKIDRIKTELWFKECLLNRHPVPLPYLTEGHYTAYAVRKTKNNLPLLGYVELKIEHGQLTVIEAGVTEGELIWLSNEHLPLQRLQKIFNQSFYLYDHDTDILLTSYNSIRVPRIIGPAQQNVVNLYAFQEREKMLTEHSGKPFSGYTITRSAKPQKNVLPYLISPGRSNSDTLAKSKNMKHHHIYLQSHENGLFVLMSNAQPTHSAIAKPNLVENLLIWDAQGNTIDVLNHPLTGVYLNSFTLDMLKSGESSKSSIFAKLARLMVEN